MEKNKGFSLVELIVVMAIMGILVAGSIVAILSNKTMKVNSAINTMDSALNRAMTMAMSKGNVAGLIVYEVDGTYYAAIITSTCSSGSMYSVTEDKVVQKYTLGRQPLTISFSYVDMAGNTISPVTLSNQTDATNMTTAAEFLFKRDTGAIKEVQVGAQSCYYDKVTVSFSDKSKTMKIYAKTGKHEIQ